MYYALRQLDNNTQKKKRKRPFSISLAVRERERTHRVRLDFPPVDIKSVKLKKLKLPENETLSESNILTIRIGTSAMSPNESKCTDVS